jgi:hypothetical protein
MSTSTPSFGNFDALNLPKWDREMIQSGFEAVQSVEGGWEFLKTYDPPADQGFMFSAPPPKQQEIDEEISKRYGGHSGASYGCTMRVLQSIAKYGWAHYAKRMLEEYGPPPSPPPIAKALEQAATVDTFLGTLPATSDLTQFATAIQNDSGMRKMIPNIDEQADALKRFADGKMSYAEMRSLCG